MMFGNPFSANVERKMTKNMIFAEFFELFFSFMVMVLLLQCFALTQGIHNLIQKIQIQTTFLHPLVTLLKGGCKFYG